MNAALEYLYTQVTHIEQNKQPIRYGWPGLALRASDIEQYQKVTEITQCNRDYTLWHKLVLNNNIAPTV